MWVSGGNEVGKRLAHGIAGYGRGMGIMSKVFKAGVAKKAYDQARKPENQRKAKEAYASFQEKRSKRRGQPPSP